MRPDSASGSRWDHTRELDCFVDGGRQTLYVALFNRSPQPTHINVTLGSVVSALKGDEKDNDMICAAGHVYVGVEAFGRGSVRVPAARSGLLGPVEVGGYDVHAVH